MRHSIKLCMSTLALVLCAIFALTVSVITPEVEAASEAPITETKTETNTYTESEDDSIALARAIAIDEAKSEAVSIVEELKVETVEETQAETQSQQSSSSEETTSSSSSSTSGSSTTQSSGGSYVAGATQAGYLLGIDNPDPNYTSYAIHLSDADRDLAERIVMGEAGSMGYTGMAIVAQCLRDAFVMGGHSDIATVISKYGYYGSTSIKPSQACKDAVNFIFDQGGAAVQHRTLVFYSTAYCQSSWHEAQDFVCQYGVVRFFDF
ncbi:MAG: hypothetical protein IJO20_04570 [Ruminococcus sp.]|nr:hypothetical protein [Ruminococcus sp.]MBQ7133752.1 hypothetical protein [Ruminococcus sp.]